MKIVAVAPEPRELMQLSLCIRQITPPGTSVESFCDPLFARQYVFHNPVDRVYALADMNRMDGIELLQIVKKEQPAAQGYILWKDEAFLDASRSAGADGYIVMPVTTDKLLDAEEPEGVDALD